MGLKIRVTVECINEFDNSIIYSCDADYSSSGNILIQSEVDDHTKAMASDALYMTHMLLREQIKTEISDKEDVTLRLKNEN